MPDTTKRTKNESTTKDKTKAPNDGEPPETSLFSAVGQLLLENRALQLARDVEQTRLELFWLVYNMHRLNEALRLANARVVGCACSICIYYYRDTASSPLRASRRLKKCPFAAWLVAQLAAFGLGTTRFRDSVCVKCCFAGNRPCRAVDPDRDCITHLDCHFATSGPSDGFFRYGGRLYGAASVRDPELGKLRRFVAFLEGPAHPREPIEAEWDGEA